MEDKKKINWFLIIAIILCLCLTAVGAYVVCDKVFANKTNTSSGQGETFNFHITKSDCANISLENLVDDPWQYYNANTYYSSTVLHYAYRVSDINIKNKDYVFGYSVDKEKGNVTVSLNNKTVITDKVTELILNKVCQYGNYIVYFEQYEGPNIINIINTNGERVARVDALNYEYSWEKSYLSIEEPEYIEEKDDYVVHKYKYDMNSNKLEKLNYTTEPHVCDSEHLDYICVGA